jgi:cellobiose-specific phosphotransferase system component IIB
VPQECPPACWFNVCRPLQQKGVEVSIKAVPVAEFKDNLAAADIILLGLR